MQTEKALFEPERHEPLTGPAWGEEIVRGEIRSLVDNVSKARDETGLWPEGYNAALSLYSGACGILWASQELHRREFCEVSLAIAPADLSEISSAWQNYPDQFVKHDVPVSHSYLSGPVGVMMVLWKETGDPALLDRINTMIGENQTHPWMESLWGAPSTMLASSHLYEATGEERFANNVRSGAAYMWDRLERAKDLDCRIWDISLYGKHFKFTGAGHGFVGNVFPVVRNFALFDSPTREKWIDLIVDTMTETAIICDSMVNWLPVVDLDPTLSEKIVLHHCHGAPGGVIGLCDLYGRAGESFDQLLVGAGELIWHAGPLKKYPGLCHGTPGNGYALLKLWNATGDEKWLTRARAFAMAAIDQRARRIEAGQATQNSLWEGDMGLAVFLADCIEERSDFPTLDYF